jgi:hypothetical protein
MANATATARIRMIVINGVLGCAGGEMKTLEERLSDTVVEAIRTALTPVVARLKAAEAKNAELETKIVALEQRDGRPE